MADRPPSGQQGGVLALRHVSVLFAGLVLAAAPAAARQTITSLVSCAGGDCLLVRGERSDAASSVTINGQPVAVSGGRHWQVRVPLDTLRAWSGPFARTVQVAIAAPDGAGERSDVVRLPVGLLGHRVELASLTVHAR